MAYENVPFTNEDLSTSVPEIMNYFNKDYCFEIKKPIPERIKAAIKARGKEQLNITW